MMLNLQEAYKDLTNILDLKTIRHEVHEFKSDIKMVDIWYKGQFYVVQIEPDFVGISLIDDDNIGFDTTPDTKFSTNEGFALKLLEIFG